MHQNRIIYETPKILAKNAGPRNTMDQNTIVYETENFKKNVGPCTIIFQNMIICEAQKVLRKMYVHVQ